MSTPGLIEGDQRVSHPPQVAAPALANLAAVQRARRQATLVTCAGAIVPTILAMQGMASLAVDLLGFPVVVAVGLAGFLELALISFALLTRASALAGRPGGVDAAAVWGVSLASGLFSSAHELVGPQLAGVRSWEVDPGSLIAACVRLAAPLVAALLWERVLTAARREHEARSLAEVRRDRRLIAVAQDALTVREMEANAPRRLRGQSRWEAFRLRWARRRLRRSHIKALRMVGPGADLNAVLAAVGAVDVLPAATIPPGLVGPSIALSDTVSDTSAALADSRGAATAGTLVVSDSVDAGAPLPVHRSDVTDGLSDIPSSAPVDLSGVVSDRSDARGAATLAVSDNADAVSDTHDVGPTQSVDLSNRADTISPAMPVDLSDTVSGRSDARGVAVAATLAVSDTLDVGPAQPVDLSDTRGAASTSPLVGLDTLALASAQPVHLSAVSDSLSDSPALTPLAIAVELIRDDRTIAGSRIAAAMRAHGHSATDRTGLRWRDRAAAHLDAAATLS
jgi:hypothetical protein